MTLTNLITNLDDCVTAESGRGLQTSWTLTGQTSVYTGIYDTDGY